MGFYSPISAFGGIFFSRFSYRHILFLYLYVLKGLSKAGHSSPLHLQPWAARLLSLWRREPSESQAVERTEREPGAGLAVGRGRGHPQPCCLAGGTLLGAWPLHVWHRPGLRGAAVAPGFYSVLQTPAPPSRPAAYGLPSVHRPNLCPSWVGSIPARGPPWGSPLSHPLLPARGFCPRGRSGVGWDGALGLPSSLRWGCGGWGGKFCSRM